MGLAASQVRLLQLTSRQHRIEYKAQKIQAQKLQLANESDMVYNAYMNALDSKKVQFKYIENDGSVTYKDASFKSMFGDGYNSEVQNQYALEIISNDENNGKFYVPTTINGHNVINTFNSFKDYSGIDEATIKADPDFQNVEITEFNLAEYQKKYQAKKFAEAIAKSTTDASEMAYYQNMYQVFLTGAGDDKLIAFDNTKYEDSYEWLTNKLANGELLLHKWEVDGGDDGKGAWAEVSVSTDTMLQEVSDEKEVKKAEATYESETARINRKDAQYDTLLSQTETERNAIKTEMDSLKTVRNDNIDKAFKLFS